jgi:hypothetical protein
VTQPSGVYLQRLRAMLASRGSVVDAIDELALRWAIKLGEGAEDEERRRRSEEDTGKVAPEPAWRRER